MTNFPFSRLRDCRERSTNKFPVLLLLHSASSVLPPWPSFCYRRFWSWSDQGGGAVLGWRVLLAMAQSMLPGQQAAAWDALKALPLDASEGFALCGTIGRLTRTAAKWWVATRPAA